MGLIENCENYFATRNLYEVLGIEKSATESEIKTAYKKTSLKVHPDRVEENHKEEATRKFQILAQIYYILSDQERRAVYDETGEVDDENVVPEDRDWIEYWRLNFPKLSFKDIDEFVKKYKGSKDEVDDLKQCYIRFQGDMEKISEHMLCYDNEEEDRYIEIIKDLIKEGSVTAFQNFKKDSNARNRTARKKKYAGEAAEAEEMRKKMELGDDDDEASLRNAIIQRRPNRMRAFDSMISSLEAKYATQPEGKKKKKSKRGKK